jgi:hypothetical protein
MAKTAAHCMDIIIGLLGVCLVVAESVVVVVAAPECCWRESARAF